MAQELKSFTTIGLLMDNYLLLFDIDGTLLHPNGAGSKGVLTAFEQFYGKRPDLSRYHFDGKTDRRILRDLASQINVPQETFAADFNAFADLVYRHIGDNANSNMIEPAPNISELLAFLDDLPNVYLGLTTGNAKAGARYKLEAVGLYGYFPVGAFGSESENRNDLPPLARQRAAKHFAVDWPNHNIWIIGDTPADIECGRVNGFKTLAVATGRYRCSELQAHQPDLCEALLTIPIFQRILNGNS
jgi:phosphoglycolate phosphatase